MSMGITYRVRVNWTGKALDWTGAHADVTADVEKFRIKIGRDKMQSKVNAGTLDLTFYDNGKYNPYNASSVLYGQLLPMRAVIVDCSVDGGGTYPYTLFQGWSRTGTSNPDFGTNQAGLHAEDVFLRLSRFYPVIAEVGSTNVGTAIGLILDALDPTIVRSLDLGDVIPHFNADGTSDALALISNLMDIQQGLFFQAPSGTVTMFDRNHWTAGAALGTVDLAQSTLPGYDLDSVINKATLTASGGTAQTNSDATSIADYDEADFGGLGDASYLRNDTHANDLGNYIVTTYANPSDRIWDVVVSEGPAGYLPIMLGATLWDSPTLATPAITGDYLIESIQHAGEGGKLHRTSWGLRAKPPASAWPMTLDDSARGLDYVGMAY